MTQPYDFIDGYRLIDGEELNNKFGHPVWSTAAAVKATSNGTLANSQRLTETISQITIAVLPNASVVLPQALPGQIFIVLNSTLNPIVVYADGGSTIDSAPGNVGVSQGSAEASLYFSVQPYQWLKINFPPFSLNYTIDTIAQLRTYSPASGTTAYVNGYYTIGDGGGGAFYGVSGQPAGTFVENYGTVILPTGGDGSKAWLRVISGTIFTKMFGAVGDGVADDTTAIQRAIDYLQANVQFGASSQTSGKKCLAFTQGKYLITAPINLKYDLGVSFQILGNNAVISTDSDIDMLYIQGYQAPASRPPNPPTYIVSNIHISNLNFQGCWNLTTGAGNTSNNAVHILAGIGLTFNDCTLTGCYKAVYGEGMINTSFNNCYFRNSFYGIDSLPGTVAPSTFSNNVINFTNCLFNHLQRAVRCVNNSLGPWCFYGCNAESINLETGTATDGVKCFEFMNAPRILFAGCYLEAFAGQYGVYYDGRGGGNSSLTIESSYIAPGNYPIGYTVYSDNTNSSSVGSSQITVIGSTLGHPTLPSQSLYLGRTDLTKLSTSCAIIGNFFGQVGGVTDRVMYFNNGSLSVGSGEASPLARLVSTSTFQAQARFVYDATNYQTVTVNSAGSVSYSSFGATPRFIYNAYLDVTSATTGAPVIALKSSSASFASAIVSAVADAGATPANFNFISCALGSTNHFRVRGDGYIFPLDGTGIVAGTSTGFSIGTGINQKIGFYGTTPDIQPVGGGGYATITGAATTPFFAESRSTGGSGTATYTFGDIVAALKKLGLIQN